jgi:hypothetical protein
MKSLAAFLTTHKSLPTFSNVLSITMVSMPYELILIVFSFSGHPRRCGSTCQVGVTSFTYFLNCIINYHGFCCICTNFDCIFLYRPSTLTLWLNVLSGCNKERCMPVQLFCFHSVLMLMCQNSFSNTCICG